MGRILEKNFLNKILVLGTGGLGKECCYYLKDAFGPSLQIETYSDSDTSEIPSAKSGIRFIVAVGDPLAKQTMVCKALENGLRPAPTLIHPRAFVQNPEKIGMGGIIAPGVVVAADVQIGDYVLLNYNATVGHDTVIGDFCTINPSANISGNNRIGDCVFVGVGAVTKQSIEIGDNAICGAQACCLQDVQANTTVVGVPANRCLKK